MVEGINNAYLSDDEQWIIYNWLKSEYKNIDLINFVVKNRYIIKW